jgi:two-component system phosphate regulon sensor histidine kinase PhoR
LDRFWWPIWFRFSLVGFFAILTELTFGLTWALGVGLVGLAILIGFHLYYLRKFTLWIERPDGSAPAVELPAAYGAWATVFADLRRARRRDDKQLDRVAETLTRFIEATSALPDGIVILDRGGLIEWCNPSAEKHLGLNLKRDRGFLILNLVRQPPFTEYLMRADFREPLTLSDPVAQTTLSVQLMPFQETRRMVVSRDISPFTRMETVRRDFIANVSHELRTPLTVVGGFLEQMIDQPDIAPAQRRRIEETMLDQTQRMQRLIEDLLTLSRLETHTGPERESEFPAARLVEIVAAEARALSDGRHEISVDATPMILTGSMDELRSAFANLASNAVRHTPPGGAITIVFGPDPEGAHFTVIDNGPGIAPEHLPRITERFYRVDKSRSRETGGTGLGLAIVKHALARHGGRLEIESELGHGSTFRAFLPASRVRR